LTPGVEPVAELAPADLPGLPADARVVLGVGPLERHKGFREAVWAFDIVAHVHPAPHLVLVGTGPDRARVADFARAIRIDRPLHLVGRVAALGRWLARAEVVWVPSLREGGHGAALEAMAAGKPVVASRLPGLAELLGDAGLLATPADKADLARQT